jgi:4'-phosphopantetheinyl transferase
LTIYWTDPSGLKDQEIFDLKSRWLSPPERERCEELSWKNRHDEFVVGRSLLRWALDQHERGLGRAELIKSTHGKPLLEQNADVSFNIAHTTGMIVCALQAAPSGNNQLGVDVESIERASAIDRVKQRVFSAYELQQLETLTGKQRSERLVGLWTAKEAWTKALGIGLGYDFRTVSFDIAGRTASISQKHSDKPVLVPWHLHLVQIDGDFRVAVATDREEPYPKTMQLGFNQLVGA